MNLIIQFFVISLSVLMAGSILLVVFYFICAQLKKKGKSLDKLPGFQFVYNNERPVEAPPNSRIRKENVSIFEVALSKEADFTSRTDGSAILETIRRKENVKN